MPRSSETPALTSDITIARVNTISRPWWNGWAIRCGKNSLPVSVACWAAVSPVTCAWVSNVPSGLNPRNDANRSPTGGWLAIWCAAVAGTPLALSPANIEPGRVEARPTTIKEKKMPMDSTIPLFWKVDIMPLAAPR